MKTITPVSIWHNGAQVNADSFILYVSHNNLEDIASFYYELQAGGLPVVHGNLAMTGSDYTNYNGNAYAWSWAATQLGLVII